MPTVERLEAELEVAVAAIGELRSRLDAIDPSQLSTVQLHSLGDARVMVIKPIPVTIRRDGDEFVASFLDANLSMGGSTLADAVAALQSLLADVACDLPNRPDETLGKSMLTQKRVVTEFLCQRS